MATASHGTSIGFKGAVTASKVLALTGIDLPTTTNRLKNVMISHPEMEAKLTLRSGVGQP